jgi:hypothetical protein
MRQDRRRERRGSVHDLYRRVLAVALDGLDVDGSTDLGLDAGDDLPR